MVSTGPFQTELSHKSMHLVGRSQKAGQRKTREQERYQTAPRARISSMKKNKPRGLQKEARQGVKQEKQQVEREGGSRGSRLGKRQKKKKQICPLNYTFLQ